MLRGQKAVKKGGNMPGETVVMSEQEKRQEWNRQIIAEFRANGGRVGGPFEGIPLLLLRTRGAKSGEERVNPLGYLEQDGRLYVFGSNGGRDEHPGWYFNVQADPRVIVEVGTRTAAATAVVLDRAERDRIYAAQVRRQPMFATYEQQVTRTIPVVALDLDRSGTES
jgi:deazaflavin-dependent oxidoreductase (nitroreductase family)